MTQYSFPHTDTSGDRPVSSAMAAAFHAALLSGESAVLTGLTPAKSASTVTVAAGSAIIEGRFYDNDATLTLTPAAGTRKDYIVLRYTAADRAVVLAVSEGTQEAYPARSETEAVYELVIATVDNSAGAFTVTDTRTDTTLCGFADGFALGIHDHDGLLTTAQKAALTGGASTSADAHHTHPAKANLSQFPIVGAALEEMRVFTHTRYVSHGVMLTEINLDTAMPGTIKAVFAMLSHATGTGDATLIEILGSDTYTTSSFRIKTYNPASVNTNDVTFTYLVIA